MFLEMWGNLSELLCVVVVVVFFSEETRNEIHKLILVEEDKQLELNKEPGRTSKSWKQYDSATSL